MTTARILCEYHQFFLAPFATDPILDPSRPAELAQVVEDGRALIVLTGIASGPVELALGTASTAVEDQVWEDQSSVVMDISGPLFITAPTVMNSGAPSPAFSPITVGPHCVTVCARGRDRQYDAHVMPDAAPAEQYRIVIAACGA